MIACFEIPCRMLSLREVTCFGKHERQAPRSYARRGDGCYLDADLDLVAGAATSAAGQLPTYTAWLHCIAISWSEAVATMMYGQLIGAA